MAMQWTVEENQRSMLATIEYVARAGAGMVLFPELSITGFHREILQEMDKFKKDRRWFDTLRANCRDNSIFAWVGMPVFDGERIYNSYVLIGADGQVMADIRKQGLTANEATVFASGDTRETVCIQGYNQTAVLCREVADLDRLGQQLFACELNGIVWPGFISHGIDEIIELPEGTTEQAARIAETLNCEILQCNWANSLNKPQLKDLGGSVYLNNLGEVVWQCPLGTPGIGFIDLDSGKCRWDSVYF